MKRFCFFILALMVYATGFAQVVDPEPGCLTADGPYIIYNHDGSARIISVDSDGNIHDTTGEVPRTFTVSDHTGAYTFDVTLHHIERQSWKLSETKRTFILSDPHGRMDCLVSILKAGGVIDEHLKWAYGSDRLVVNGDVMDRGDDVTQIFWLLYELEAEAAEAGGSLTFLYGNHEPMVLAGDLRYTRKKYLDLAEDLGMTVPELYGPDSELGRWIESRNTMTVIGDELFVHAGLSKQFKELNLNIPEVNEIMSRGIFMTSKERKADSDIMYTLFKTYGPVWYRGFFYKDKKYGGKMDAGTLDDILKTYKASRVYVGHTIFRNVKPFYGGKVVAVDVDAKINYDKGRTRAVLLKENRLYSVYDSGRLKAINK